MVIGLLYDLLIGVPAVLSKQIMLKIKDVIEKEGLMTEEAIKGRLQELQLRLQDGELSEEEYNGVEAELITRLRAIREYQNQRE